MLDKFQMNVLQSASCRKIQGKIKYARQGENTASAAGPCTCRRALLVHHQVWFVFQSPSLFEEFIKPNGANTGMDPEGGSNAGPPLHWEVTQPPGALASLPAKWGLQSHPRTAVRMRWGNTWKCLMNSTNTGFCFTLAPYLEPREEWLPGNYSTHSWVRHPGKYCSSTPSCLLPPSISTYQKDLCTGTEGI